MLSQSLAFLSSLSARTESCEVIKSRLVFDALPQKHSCTAGGAQNVPSVMDKQISGACKSLQLFKDVQRERGTQSGGAGFSSLCHS